MWPVDYPDNYSDNVVDGLVRQEESDCLHAAINTLLTSQDQRIIRHRYGLGVPESTLKGIGAMEGLSAQGVSIRLKRAMVVLFIKLSLYSNNGIYEAGVV